MRLRDIIDKDIDIESSSIERLLSSNEFRFETGYVDTKDLPWMIRKEVLRTTRNNEEFCIFYKKFSVRRVEVCKALRFRNTSAQDKVIRLVKSNELIEVSETEILNVLDICLNKCSKDSIIAIGFIVYNGKIYADGQAYYWNLRDKEEKDSNIIAKNNSFKWFGKIDSAIIQDKILKEINVNLKSLVK